MCKRILRMLDNNVRFHHNELITILKIFSSLYENGGKQCCVYENIINKILASFPEITNKEYQLLLKMTEKKLLFDFVGKEDHLWAKFEGETILSDEDMKCLENLQQYQRVIANRDGMKWEGQYEITELGKKELNNYLI